MFGKRAPGDLVVTVGVGSAQALVEAAARPINLVPSSITFYPLRISDNILRRGAELLTGKLSMRAVDELVVEGNILTPKLVGNSVGLHPVWLILALSVFGTLFGFVGMLVAVPVAAALGVIARFIVEQYLDSRLYQGKGHRDAE